MRLAPDNCRSAELIKYAANAFRFVVKQEPFEGQMVPGGIVLVDDGTHVADKIKEVTGGEIGAMNPRPRARRCCPRDEKRPVR
jgi:hypothetical protein